EMTFNAQNFGALDDIAVPVHPPYDIYQQFKKDAQRKTAEMDFRRLPGKMVDDMAGDLASTGYEWLGEAGVGVDPTHRTAATFLMGGLIFGSYAAAIRGDHLLQTKRSRLFMELTIAPEAQWGWKKEGELFAELDKMALQDPDVIILRD